MAVMIEIEAVMAFLVDAVAATGVDSDHNETQDEGAKETTVGGYLWKFPSEGSNQDRNLNIASENALLPPPVPQSREYPRKCNQCRVCWVSDRDYEVEHQRRCSAQRNSNIHEGTKLIVAKLGVARRVWCEVDESFTCLQWWNERKASKRQNVESIMNSIAFADITEVVMLDDLADTFQIATRDGRNVVFQWRSDGTVGKNGDATSSIHVLEMDALQWQEYLTEVSKFARDSPFDVAEIPETSSPPIGSKSSLADVFEDVASLMLIARDESDASVFDRLLESRLRSVLGKRGYREQFTSLLDDGGNSLLHLALNLNLGARTASMISTLLRMGLDCNLQNHEQESPLLLVAASGDHATMRALLASPLIQVNSSCAYGVTAFHAAANASDVEMLQLLCNAGAQPELQDENGWTALHYAAASSMGPEAIHFMCELLPDGLIDSACCEGNTPLHVAAGCGHLENVSALLQTAANPRMRNGSGESPYHLALRNNHIQCAVAINEYQSMPPLSSVEPSPSPPKENFVSGATITALNEHGFQPDTHYRSADWIESFTEDGYGYYYNTTTGESSWYKPEEYQTLDTWQTADYQDQTSEAFSSKRSEDDTIEFRANTVVSRAFQASAGQQLPLCLIPMVSPLTSLDNPTAAAKFEATRRKARAQRKRRQSKSHRTHDYEHSEHWHASYNQSR